MEGGGGEERERRRRWCRGTDEIVRIGTNKKCQICSYFLLRVPAKWEVELRQRKEEEIERERRGERRWKPEAVYKGRERLVSIWDNPKC